MSKVFIKVERGFYIERVPQKVGDVIEVSVSFARELVDARKASLHVPEPKPEPKAKAPPESKAAGKDDSPASHSSKSTSKEK